MLLSTYYMLGTGSYRRQTPTPLALLPQEALNWGSYCPFQPRPIFRAKSTPFTPLHSTPMLIRGWWCLRSVYNWRIDAIKKESKVLPRSQSKNQGSPKLQHWADGARETRWCPHHCPSFSGSPEPRQPELQSSQTSSTILLPYIFCNSPKISSSISESHVPSDGTSLKLQPIVNLSFSLLNLQASLATCSQEPYGKFQKLSGGLEMPLRQGATSVSES